MFSHMYKKMCKAKEIQDSAKWTVPISPTNQLINF